MTPLSKKKDKEAMPKFLIVMWYICYCYIVGRSLGAPMYLKTKTVQIVHLSSFIQLLQIVQVSEWCSGFCIPSLCIEVTPFGRFLWLSSDFDSVCKIYEY